jgi:hypothetical protein
MRQEYIRDEVGLRACLLARKDRRATTSVTFLAGSSNTEPGLTPQQSVTLSWATFSDAADEAGISRRCGGIHFEAGDLVGRATGRLVAAKAWHKAQNYINNEDDDVENDQDREQA